MDKKYRLESEFQKDLIEELHSLYPRAIILKNDEQYLQGISDLTFLCERFWATLEAKRSYDDPYRPNQEYYINWADDMSFSRMICPENKEEVLYELQQAFLSNR